jgi:hypothetical protein
MNEDKMFRRTKLLGLSLVLLMVFSACTSSPQLATQPPSSSSTSPTPTSSVMQIMKFEASATPQSDEASTPVQDLGPEQTSAPNDDLSPTDTASPVTTESVVADAQTCSRLQNPGPGAQLPAVGWGKFEWDAWPQAATYVLEIIAPNGWRLTIETDNTSVSRAMEAFDSGGEYTWAVYAMSATGEELCRSNTQIFSKPERSASSTPSENLSNENKGDEPPCGCGH